MDWEGPIPNSDDNVQVDVPTIDRPQLINEEQLEYLQQIYTLDRIISSDYHAADLYIELVDYIMSLSY